MQRFDAGPCGAQPIRPLGMLSPGHVVETAFVGDQQQRHASERRPSTTSGSDPTRHTSQLGTIATGENGLQRAATVKNLTVARGRTVRVGPWRNEPTTASVATFVDQHLDRAAVSEIVTRLRAEGYDRIVTAALTRQEQDAFLACGFEPLRTLALLRRPLSHPVPRSDIRVKRWRRRRHDDILRVDAAAFDDFWRFDETALREALDATPHRILRVDASQPPLGYALSGVARSRAYLQRLAVHPDAAGHGIGTGLLLDALRWMRWRGADEAYVNTQDDNERALALYHRHGFESEAEGLAILELPAGR